MLTTLGLAFLSTFCLGCGHRAAAETTPAVAIQDSCEGDSKAVREWIEILEHGSRPRIRDKAARLLRKFDRRAHPEIVAALINALRNDCAGKVREEAAESLAKLSVREAIVHENLAIAAERDPHRGTRRAAKRGLKRLSRRCVDDCEICGPRSSIVPTERFELPNSTPEGLLEPLPSSAPAPIPPADDSVPVEPIPVPENRLDSPRVSPPLEPDLEGPTMGSRRRAISSRPDRTG